MYCIQQFLVYEEPHKCFVVTHTIKANTIYQNPIFTYMTGISSSLSTILMPATMVLSLDDDMRITSSKLAVTCGSSSAYSNDMPASSCCFCAPRSTRSVWRKEREWLIRSHTNCATLLCFSPSESQPSMLISRGTIFCSVNHWQRDAVNDERMLHWI